MGESTTNGLELCVRRICVRRQEFGGGRFTISELARCVYFQGNKPAVLPSYINYKQAGYKILYGMYRYKVLGIDALSRKMRLARVALSLA